MNDSSLEFIENACSWWENLDDGEKSQFIGELYARENQLKAT